MTKYKPFENREYALLHLFCVFGREPTAIRVYFSYSMNVNEDIGSASILLK